MSSLVEVLYPAPDLRRTPLSSLRWWESRRLVFNQAVGAAGVVSFAGVWLFAMLPPHPAVLSLPAMLAFSGAYAVAANLCYTLGWAGETLARRLLGPRLLDVAPLLFRQGLIFSVGLTLLPLLLAAFSWVVRIVLAVTS